MLSFCFTMNVVGNCVELSLFKRHATFTLSLSFHPRTFYSTLTDAITKRSSVLLISSVSHNMPDWFTIN